MDKGFLSIVFVIVLCIIATGQWIWILFFNGANKFIAAVDEFYKGSYREKIPYKLFYQNTTIKIISTIFFLVGIFAVVLIMQGN